MGPSTFTKLHDLHYKAIVVDQEQQLGWKKLHCGIYYRNSAVLIKVLNFRKVVMKFYLYNKYMSKLFLFVNVKNIGMGGSFKMYNSSIHTLCPP